MSPIPHALPGRWGIVVVAALTACSPREYEPHSPHASLGVSPEAIRTLGCLDVGLSLGLHPEIPRGDLLLSLHVGNRCQHAEPFDLSAMRMVARSMEGAQVDLDFVDPRREIGPRHLDASTLAEESIQIAAEIPEPRLVEICFDLRDVAPDAVHARPEPLCLRRHEEGWAP